MDALVRHKKAEHGEGSLEKPNKPISAPIIAASHNSSTSTFNPTHQHINNTTTLTTTATTTTNNNTNKHKKIPKTSLDILSKKRPRNGKKSRSGFYSSGEESDDSLPVVMERGTTQKSLLSGSVDYNQYRLAKAQLHYILRENEMLQDEFDMAQKKLKRMRTERRVLLDAVMATEKLRHGRTQVEEEQEEQVDSYEHIPNDQAA
jgi:hypothetical protein